MFGYRCCGGEVGVEDLGGRGVGDEGGYEGGGEVKKVGGFCLGRRGHGGGVGGWDREGKGGGKGMGWWGMGGLRRVSTARRDVVMHV